MSSGAAPRRRIPEWREHLENRKTAPLTEPGQPPETAIIEFLERSAAELGKQRDEVRVLDFGCGRGALASWLLANGWDAWGVDVAEEYLVCGDRLTRDLAGGEQRLWPAAEDLPQRIGTFDVILSTQVLEHVMDLDGFADQVAKLSRPGTRGLHILPARWIPLEPHMNLPLVHWIPKGRKRKAAIRLLLRLGLGVSHFSEYALAERTEIFTDFSENETDYKSERKLGRAFSSVGMACEFRTVTLAKIRHRARWLPAAVASPLAALYSTFRATYMTTHQIH